MSDLAIDGMISTPPGGAAGNDDVWYLVLQLCPWRHPDGHFEDVWLRVERRVGTHAALKRAMATWSEGTAVRVTTSKIAPPPPGGRWWTTDEVTRIAKTTPDRKLSEAWHKSLEPIVVQDAELGRMTVDRRFDAFTGKRRLGWRRYALWIFRSTEGTPAAQVRAARAKVARFEGDLARIVEAISDKMLELYNDTWRGYGLKLSRTGFAKRLHLEAAHLQGDRTTLFMNAGRLFAGHGIDVRLDEDGKIREILLGG